jgi:serine-type D-Ala-D-Ala carboxypeptidase (penicillin-binding protein 5/6)
MKLRYIFLFPLVALSLLFYPGDQPLLHTYAFHRELFANEKTYALPYVNPIPYVLNQSYQPSVSAVAVSITDLSSYTPIYQRSERLHLKPASTAKILTALVAYDLYRPEDIITIHQPLNDGQVMGLVENERITVENLMYGLLVYSGNDAAYALAQKTGVDTFVRLMNQKAKSLSMNDSVFSNPAGLDGDGVTQYTSAYDLTLAGRALLKNPYLSKFVSTKEIEVSDVDFKYFHKLTNVNKLLGEIQGVGGLKTGYTIEAGQNLVSFYKRQDDHDFIIVVLKSLDRFEDTKNLILWTEQNVGYISNESLR